MGVLASRLPGQNIIATVAGSPQAPPSGNVSGSVSISPVVVAAGPSGDIFFIDQPSHSVLKLTPGGDVIRIAGTGIEGYSGDGGPADAAALSAPFGLAVDSTGNLYISDAMNQRIRRVDARGIITTVAGNGVLGFSGDGGSATSAQIRFPAGLAIDSSGNLFFADRGNFRVRKIDRAGIITTIAGNGGTAATGDGGPALNAGFGFPEFVAVDNAGNVFISDSAGSRIRRVTPAGIISTVAGTGTFGYSGDGGPATSAAITIPQAIAADQDGSVYFADWIASRIRRFRPGGNIETVAGNGQLLFAGDGGKATAASLANPQGLAIGPGPTIIIADGDNARLRQVDSTGNISTIAGTGSPVKLGDNGPATNAGLSRPSDVVESQGLIYFSDRGNSRIRRINADGTIQTVAGRGVIGFGGDNGPGTAALLADPRGLSSDPSGALYIADRANHRIRRLDPRGTITTVAGTGQLGGVTEGGPATSATLAFPTAVAADTAGNLFIADSGNHVVRRVGGTGLITTYAGTGSPGFSGDGGQARSAALNGPSGLTTDRAGNLYIVDTNNDRVRKVTPAGIITTIAGTGTKGYVGDGGPATAATLFGPIGIRADAAGNLYLADRQNFRVRRISTSGIITTIAGIGTSGVSGDGGLATNAPLSSPEGVGVDQNGNVFIADRDNNRIRAVLANPPTFTSATTELTFSVTSGGSVSAEQSVSVLPVAGSPNLNATGMPVAVTAAASWIKISPGRGSMPFNFNVSVDPANLAAGSHESSISVVSPVASPGTRLISVKVNANPSAQPKLGLNSGEITVTVNRGAEPVTRDLVVSNQGGGLLLFSADIQVASGASWLRVDSVSGSATPVTPGTIVVTADPSGLAPGTYSGTLTITTSSDERREIPVTLAVAGSQNAILLSQTGLTFRAVAGGGAPLSQSTAILNSGSGQMNWTAKASTLAGGSWLSVSNTSGSVARALVDISPVEIVANSAGLAPGDYYGQIQVESASADNSPQYVSVLLTVLPAGSRLGPDVQPSGLVFTGTPTSTPGAQSVFVSNRGSTTFNYASGRFTVDGQPWLAHLPTNQAVPPNQPAKVTVQTDFRGLTPGIYRGAITFQNVEDGTLRTINVLSVVSAGGANTASGFRAANGCVPDRVRILLTNSEATITGSPGQPVPIEVIVVDSCGDPVTATTPGASVELRMSSNEPAGPMVHSGNGKWSRTYQPRSGNGSTVVATVTVFLIGASGKVLGEQLDMSISLGARRATPIVGAGGVLNAASFESNKPLAPGSLVTFKGEQLAAAGPGIINSGLPVSTTLNGTEVRLANRALPLFYAEAGQINAQLPFDLPPNTQHHLVIYREDALSVPEQITIAAAKPAIFAVNQQGTGQGAIVNGVTNLLADTAYPVAAGDVITIYCTGLGIVSPAVPAGTVAPNSPLSSTVNPVTVSVGGVPATVLYSGLAPGTTGLYQVNAVVPAGVPPGPEVTVLLTSTGQTAEPVTIAVQ